MKIKVGNAKQERISTKLLADLKIVAVERIKKGFANPLHHHEISMRELSELLTRTPAYKSVLEQLKTMPKRRDDVIV